MTYLFTSINVYSTVLRDAERNVCTNFIATYVGESRIWLKRQTMSATVRTHLKELPDA